MTEGSQFSQEKTIKAIPIIVYNVSIFEITNAVIKATRTQPKTEFCVHGM